MIIERYSPIQPRSLAEAVDDIIYLFQTRRSPRDGLPSFQNLLFIAGNSSSFKRVCYVYVEEPNTTSLISKYAVDPETDACQLLNALYTAKARELERELDFVQWLRTNFDVASKPRLVDSSRRRNLTKEFYFLCTHASRELLVFLRDDWKFYALDLESTDSALNKRLSGMEVRRIDGAIRPLDQTMLPRDTLMAAAPNIVPLDIPDGAGPRWNKLAHLGVLCSRTLTLYRRQLRRLSYLNVVDTTTAAADAAYAGLQSSLSGVNAQVK